MKQKPRNADFMVQAKDCYDPADYIMVHKDHYRRLLESANTDSAPVSSKAAAAEMGEQS